MFGLSISEVVIIAIVAIVVVGPRHLPTMMRSAGQWVSRIRRMSTDLRAQSGIDQLIREEGLERDLREIKNLANVNVLDSLESFVGPAVATAPIASAPVAAPSSSTSAVPLASEDREVSREREYPLVGCDAYDALPDDSAYSAEGYAPDFPMPVPTEEPTAFNLVKDPGAS